MIWGINEHPVGKYKKEFAYKDHDLLNFIYDIEKNHDEINERFAIKLDAN